MIDRLLIATTNAGKLAEIEAILEGIGVELHGLSAVGPIPEPEETGATFAENARIKALTYSAATGLPTVAEDSGLEIDWLNGEPGVMSARFAGAAFPDKFREIYRRLDALGRGRESPARFVCALALAKDGRVRFEARGTVEGRIAPEPRGTGGFGYDPIFFYPPLGRTLAEISTEEKSRVSHRGHAFAALRQFLLAGVDTGAI